MFWIYCNLFLLKDSQDVRYIEMMPIGIGAGKNDLEMQFPSFGATENTPLTSVGYVPR